MPKKPDYFVASVLHVRRAGALELKLASAKGPVPILTLSDGVMS
jgi:hypothetical protein